MLYILVCNKIITLELYDLIHDMIKLGADYNHLDYSGKSVFMNLIYNKNYNNYKYKLIDLFLDLDINILHIDYNKWSVLSYIVNTLLWSDDVSYDMIDLFRKLMNLYMTIKSDSSIDLITLKAWNGETNISKIINYCNYHPRECINKKKYIIEIMKIFMYHGYIGVILDSLKDYTYLQENIIKWFIEDPVNNSYLLEYNNTRLLEIIKINDLRKVGIILGCESQDIKIIKQYILDYFIDDVKQAQDS